MALPDKIEQPTGLRRLREHESTALRRPHDLYRAQLKARGSVYWDDDFSAFVVLGEAEVKGALRRPDVFSSQNSRGPAAMAVEDQVRAAAVASPDMQDLVARGYGRNLDVRAGSNADPPRHTTQRALIAPAFSPRRVRSFGEVISEVARAVLDGLAAKVAASQPVDLVADFARPLPLRALAAVLGIEEHRVDDYAKWSVGLLKPVGRIGVEPSELAEMVQCRKEFDRYFADLIADRLASPRDDFMSDFAQTATMGDAPLALDEMLAIVEQFVIAGHETTTKLLGNMLILLVEHPGLADQVRASQDALDALIDESLRLEAPAQIVNRITVADTVLGGVAIPQGSPVMIFIASANRDTVADADSIDLTRQDRRGHYGFGFGIHFCVGHSLARIEATIAMGLLLDRFDISLVGGADRDAVTFVPSYAMHGPSQLPATLLPRKGAA